MRFRASLGAHALLLVVILFGCTMTASTQESTGINFAAIMAAGPEKEDGSVELNYYLRTCFSCEQDMKKAVATTVQKFTFKYITDLSAKSGYEIVVTLSENTSRAKWESELFISSILETVNRVTAENSGIDVRSLPHGIVGFVENPELIRLILLNHPNRDTLNGRPLRWSGALLIFRLETGDLSLLKDMLSRHSCFEGGKTVSENGEPFVYMTKRTGFTSYEAYDQLQSILPHVKR